MDKKFWNDRKINDMTLISIFSCSETKKGYCRKENKSDFIVVVKVDQLWTTIFEKDLSFILR